MVTAPDRDRQILAVVNALVPGEVSTYGDIASVAGFPGRARLVGRLLANVGDHGGNSARDAPGTESDVEPELPWWRVVTASGRLVPGHEAEQIAMLIAEGVRTAGGHVVEAPRGRFSPRRGTTVRSHP
jgi:methylated-DNA-protein-cysteine methyltransferase-like protein